MAKHITHCAEEETTFDKILNYRLPYSFKKLGLTAALLTFLFLLSYKYIGSNALIMKDILRTLVLFFLLIASLSQDKIEDEYHRHIRFQSYMLAFVITTAYSILMPLLVVALDVVITKARAEGIVEFYELSSFEILFVLLGFQLLFFEVFKKFGSCRID